MRAGFSLRAAVKAGGVILAWVIGSAGVPAATAEDGERWMSLEVSVNGSDTGTWALLERGGLLYAPEAAFEQWRLSTRANVPVLQRKGEGYVALSAIRSLQIEIDYTSQAVRLQAPPEAFRVTRLAPERAPAPAVQRAEPSAFVNYDLSYTHARYQGGAYQRDLGALLELGWSGPAGLLTSTHVGRNLLDAERRTFTRLETTFTRHMAPAGELLRVGDAVAVPGLQGRGFAFGGVQWSSDESVAPGARMPLVPTLSGQAVAASTMELYINDVLRQVSSVPAGPFTVEPSALPAGASEARLVVRDLLGRETVVVQPLFTHSDLLDAGAARWSAEAGALRRRFAEADADYGAAFAAAQWRSGISRGLNLELSGHASRTGADAGAGLLASLPWGALGIAALSLSRYRGLGGGAAWTLGLEGDFRRFNYALRAEGATRAYRYFGDDLNAAGYRRQLGGSMGIPGVLGGSVQLAAGQIGYADGGRPQTTASLGWTRPVGRHANLAFTLLRASGANSGTSLLVNLMVPLDGGIVAGAASTWRDHRFDASVSASAPLGQDSEWGWRALAGRQDGLARSEGGLYRQGAAGVFSADVSASPQQATARLGWQGGLAYMGGHLFATRRLDQSFALVEVAGYPDLDIHVAGAGVARTGEGGLAFLPRLQPLQENRIRLDANALPINAELDSIEQVAVPPWRGGVKVSFPVRGGRGALIRVVLDDGEAAPVGASVTLLQRGQAGVEPALVARKGDVFVTGLQASTNVLRLEWLGQHCEFSVDLPAAGTDEIPRIGPVACHGVRR
jgi:outer membrane usher protein